MDGPADEIITSRFIAFTDEMNVLLSAADLVVSRAGAGAIAEIVRCAGCLQFLFLYPLLLTTINCTMLVSLKLKGAD